MVPRIYYLLILMLIISVISTNCKKKKHKYKLVHSLYSKLRRNAFTNFEEDEYLVDFDGILRHKFAFITGALNPDVSFVGSPLAALFPLGKLVLGAQNNTETELLHMIGMQNINQVDNTFKGLKKQVTDVPGVQIDMLSQVYLTDHKREYQAYSSKVKNIFGSDVLSMDMDKPEIVAANINVLVATHTEGKITQMIEAKDLKKNMQLLILNAITFEGTWKYTFRSTRLSTFYGLKGEKNLMYMNTVASLDSTESEVLNAKILIIPFGEGDVNMVIVLPNYRNGLPLLVKQLKEVPTILNNIEFGEYSSFVNVTIPMFKLGTFLDLGKLYQKMGMRETFRGEGLTKMAEGTVFLDKAIQKTVVEITSKGKYTPYVPYHVDLMSNTAYGASQFKANHPFLFFILIGTEQLFAGEFYGNGRPRPITFESSNKIKLP